jgi:hypothetical protein
MSSFEMKLAAENKERDCIFLPMGPTKKINTVNV